MADCFKKGLVSVVIPTYNHVNFLDETLESVTGQTYTDLEIIVCDDCSTDGTVDKLRDWVEKDRRIILITSDRNEGLSPNLNKGFDRASGEFLSILGGDDKMRLDKIEKQVQFLKNNSDYDVVLHWVEMFDSKSGEKLSTINLRILKSPLDWALPKVSFGISEKRNNSTFPPASYLARSSYALHSRYDFRLKYKNEILFAIDNYMNKPEAKWFCIPEVLGYYRLHENNMHRSKEMFDALLEETYVNCAIACVRYPSLARRLKRILKYYLYRELHYLSVQTDNIDRLRIRLAKMRFRKESSFLLYCYAMAFLKAKIFYRHIQRAANRDRKID
jgi:glycosyltransferase involved in cell wall biosynthesis